ncbi:MAG: PhoU domain-containing protein [Halohasta sp.]
MDTRKVQSVGGGTHTVSLPKSWSRANGVAPGDVVDVHQHRDGVLAIQPQECEYGEPTQPTVRVDAESTDRLEATLRAAYAAGLRGLTLESTAAFSAAQRRTVDEVATTLTGMSVVDRSPTEIVVRVLLDSDEISVAQSVRQLCFVALSMHETAMESVIAGSTPVDIGRRDDQADRLAAMVDRSFLRAQARLDEVDALGYDRPRLFELWATARELERIADHAETIASVAPAVDPTAACDAGDCETALDELRRVADETRTLVSDAVGLIVDEPDADAAHDLLAVRDELRETIAAGAADDPEPMDGVRYSVARTAEHGGNIAEFGLQRAIRVGESTDDSVDASDATAPEQ